MPPSSRKLWMNPRVILAILLVFTSGALTGALAMRFGLRSQPAPSTVYYQIGEQRVALEKLVKELDLNPSQAAQLETVLDDFVMYVQMLQTQMDEVRASGKAKILTILDDKQRVKFEKMMGELQARRQ